MDVCSFLKAVLVQDEHAIRSYFHKDAYVNWHCTNEHFNVDEFIVANCEYPGDWDMLVIPVEEKSSRDKQADIDCHKKTEPKKTHKSEER